jgi:hypothetical protein
MTKAIKRPLIHIFTDRPNHFLPFNFGLVPFVHVVLMLSPFDGFPVVAEGGADGREDAA